jgi:SNF2 family DNA or RNA helicase
LGFDDSRFELPKLIENEHIVESCKALPGFLFALSASNFYEERLERRQTIQERCEHAASLASAHNDATVLWCHMNDEGDLMEKMIKGSVQISGKDSDEKKEEAYAGFADGSIKKLITKPKIGAWGLNWQHCNHVISFASHSYEQYYQQVRRCWRYGQKREVTVDLIASEGEVGIKNNMRRKAELADKMFTSLVSEMNNAIGIKKVNTATNKTEVPSWL